MKEKRHSNWWPTQERQAHLGFRSIQSPCPPFLLVVATAARSELGVSFFK